jgi:uncharacterized protein (DUF433 family)/DNA-binding transcriptional MerR regulator
MYPSHIAATLSGASLRQIQYWRETRVLTPEHGKVNGRMLYSFRDVVALRTFVKIREEHPLQFIRKAVANLEELGNVDHIASLTLGLAPDGTIVWENEGDYVGLHKRGQLGIVAVMREVFKPFATAAGNRVVDLWRPRQHLSVDPEVLSGYPVIAGTRVEFDAVASLVDDGIAPENVHKFYRSVSAAAAEDASKFQALVSEYRAGRTPSAA